MAISKQTLRKAVAAIAAVPHVEMSPQRLAEDVLLLSYVFTQEDEYLVAVSNTCRALTQLVQDAVTPAPLDYAFAGWLSYHYQHRVGQGQRADMRIVFMRTKDGIRVRAFGHRNLPHDFYERLKEVSGS